ncbi:MAG TPA: hypothetical protein VFP65_22840 [Anaeromyxobacteraceae bacterium]|nr:hypothetical protein [Anaeromyxobacteraceae bacterium]
MNERDRAESALAESERKYRELFESMIEAYCVIEMILDERGQAVDFRYVETNPAFVKHATRPMLGMRIKEIVPDLEQFWLDRYGRVAMTGEPARLEHVVAGLGDQWFRTVAFRLGGPGSRRVAVLFENVTERKRNEAERARLAEHLQLALDAARLGWWHHDPSSGMASFDGRFAETFGLSAREAPVEALMRQVHPEDASRVRAAFEAALDPVDPQRYATERRHRPRPRRRTRRWRRAERHRRRHRDGPGRDRAPARSHGPGGRTSPGCRRGSVHRPRCPR